MDALRHICISLVGEKKDEEFYTSESKMLTCNRHRRPRLPLNRL